MAATQFTILAITAILLLPSTAVATEYIVGDGRGWTTNFNYTQWAADKMFYVGDTLVFNYSPGLHNVFRISTPEAFKSCEKPEPKLALTSGKDVITLATPGKKWYICGVAVHCAQFNQKLAITVMDAPAPSPGNPWSSNNDISPSPYSSGFSTVASKGFQMVAAVVAVAFVL